MFVLSSSMARGGGWGEGEWLEKWVPVPVLFCVVKCAGLWNFHPLHCALWASLIPALIFERLIDQFGQGRVYPNGLESCWLVLACTAVDQTC